MSFDYRLRADSSDEEEADSLDLSAWKDGAGTKQSAAAGGTPQAPASVTPVVRPNGHDDGDDDDDSDEIMVAGVATSQSARTPKRTHSTSAAAPSQSPPRRSFTSINQPTPQPSTSVSATVTNDQPMYDATMMSDSEEENDDSALGAGRSLVPVISHVEADDDEIQKFTTGDDVVRRVLKELEGEDGEMAYKVEFEDRSTEKVRLSRLWHFVNHRASPVDFTSILHSRRARESD